MVGFQWLALHYNWDRCEERWDYHLVVSSSISRDLNRTGSLLTEEQFVELYKSHRKKIYSLCYTFSRTEAQDWTEEIFLRVWTHRETFRGMCKPSTWLYKIAIRYCLMQTRSGKDRVFVPVEEGSKVTHSTQYTHILVQQLLGKMKPEEAHSECLLAIGDGNASQLRNLRYRGRQRATRG